LASFYKKTVRCVVQGNVNRLLSLAVFIKDVVLGKYNTQKDSCVDKSNTMIESLLSLDYTNFVNTIFHLVF